MRPIRSLPVDSPAAIRRRHPDEFLHGRRFRVVIEQRGSLIESARVPGIAITKTMEVEMMAKLVAQRTQKCAE